jgi:hypothetical protein
MRRFLFICLTLCLVAPLRADETKSEEKPIKVPFTLLSSGHFLVNVKLNDKGPYKLIFDTGAPTMLINNRIAKDSGVMTAKTPRPLFAPFGAAGPLTIKSVRIGDVEAEKISAMVMDHPTVEIFSKHYKKDHGPIDGIVGFPFFARFKLTVDYQAKELTFVPNGYKPTDVMQAMMATMMSGMSGDSGKPKVVSASGQWGMTIHKETSDEDAGVIIDTIRKGSPAEKAGLKTGDRLLTIDGRWTDSVGDTYQAASFVKPGKKIPVTIKRDGKEMTIEITPVNGL